MHSRPSSTRTRRPPTRRAGCWWSRWAARSTRRRGQRRAPRRWRRSHGRGSGPGGPDVGPTRRSVGNLHRLAEGLGALTFYNRYGHCQIHGRTEHDIEWVSREMDGPRPVPLVAKGRGKKNRIHQGVSLVAGGVFGTLAIRRHRRRWAQMRAVRFTPEARSRQPVPGASCSSGGSRPAEVAPFSRARLGIGIGWPGPVRMRIRGGKDSSSCSSTWSGGEGRWFLHRHQLRRGSLVLPPRS